jgi:hypothetical protein
MSNYYTHRDYLRKELENLNYNEKITCLEFGTGDGSAVLFKEYSDKYPNMVVVAYESDKEWLDNTRVKYSNKNYTFKDVESWDGLLVDENFKDTYDLVFVDQAPFEARIQTIDFIKNKSKIIVLHDYDFYNKGVCSDIFSVSNGSFFYEKYSQDFDLIPYYELLPPTLVMKNKNF